MSGRMGRKAGMAGVNTCELLINIVNPERAKGTDRPDPKWERSWTFLF
ncbi:hypothetical protein EC50588_A0007 [Escherichia coli 5.0588]|nr:hypothetical protein EC50588_A0007 [Escherichia coli 5.0588]